MKSKATFVIALGVSALTACSSTPHSDLSMAIERGDMAKVEAILQKQQLNSCDGLLASIRERNPNAVSYFLDPGKPDHANPNCASSYASALTTAMDVKFDEGARTLLARGANPNWEISQGNRVGWTASDVAAYQGFVPGFALLGEKGGRMNQSLDRIASMRIADFDAELRSVREANQKIHDQQAMNSAINPAAAGMSAIVANIFDSSNREKEQEIMADRQDFANSIGQMRQIQQRRVQEQQAQQARDQARVASQSNYRAVASPPSSGQVPTGNVGTGGCVRDLSYLLPTLMPEFTNSPGAVEAMHRPIDADIPNRATLEKMIASTQLQMDADKKTIADAEDCARQTSVTGTIEESELAEARADFSAKEMNARGACLRAIVINREGLRVAEESYKALVCRRSYIK